LGEKRSVLSVRVPLRRDTSERKRPTQAGHFADSELPNRTAKSFGRIPATVLSDSNLSDRDKVVYASMAIFERGGSVTSGIRYMAQACCLSRTTFARGLQSLVDRGHVQRNGSVALGRRQSYSLCSVVFAGALKGRPAAAEAVSAPIPQTCPKCERQVRLNKIGVCYRCADELRWNNAKGELGQGATREQVARFLDLKRITKRWERVARRAERAA
jgi:hypothetical protein